ncbi:hypothetical protein NXS19_010143 [Fusarium pseudograminearum]|nr:hypothetical protein NXS19_010143 [Fusarium pseudograminearum]
MEQNDVERSEQASKVSRRYARCHVSHRSSCKRQYLTLALYETIDAMLGWTSRKIPLNPQDELIPVAQSLLLYPDFVSDSRPSPVNITLIPRCDPCCANITTPVSTIHS